MFYKHLHSTHKEVLATALAFQFLIPFIPGGSRVELKTDSASTAFLWSKGSRIRSLTQTINKVYLQVHVKKIFLVPMHLKGVLNRRADWLSRNPDPKNYKLDPQIFQKVCKTFKIAPTVDLFASRQNRQVQRFCSWRVDPKSLGNAWDLDWSKELGWCNPPWDIIPQVLSKIQRDKATVLCCLPLWKSKSWYPLLLDLMSSPPLLLGNTKLFQSPEGGYHPPQ